jgi:hypothetical protein
MAPQSLNRVILTGVGGVVHQGDLFRPAERKDTLRSVNAQVVHKKIVGVLTIE